MTWVTWRQYRYQGALVAVLFAVLAVVLLLTGLHAAQVWHSALAGCAKSGTCASLVGSNLSLSTPAFVTLVVATSAVPVLPGLFWGAPMVAQELETGTHQFAWTQSITRLRWLAVRTGWLLLGAAVLAGAVSAVVTWWSGPSNALTVDAFQVNRFDITDIVPVGYGIFAMALGTVYYKLTAPFTPTGSYLEVSQGILGPNGQPPAAQTASSFGFNGVQVPAVCQQSMSSNPNPQAVLPCLAAHGYRGYVTYQPASRFWAFQGIETGIFVVLAAALLAVTFWVLQRRDA